MDISEEVFQKMLDRSSTYKSMMKLEYDDKTVTKVSKLFQAAAVDRKEKIVGYLLK